MIKRVSAPAASASILLVDDDPDLLRFIAATLGRYGFNVLPAESPQQALRIHSKRQNEIGLLLTDVIMPQMNGPELAQALHQKDPGLKILFMSGYKADHLERFGEILRGFEVLSKPFTP